MLGGLDILSVAVGILIAATIALAFYLFGDDDWRNALSWKDTNKIARERLGLDTYGDVIEPPKDWRAASKGGGDGRNKTARDTRHDGDV